MNRICLLIIVPALLIIAVFLVLHLGVRCIEGRPRSHGDMMKEAKIAIEEAGGADVLEKEASLILSASSAGSGEGWKSISIDGTNCPGITRLAFLLAPYGHGPWIVPNRNALPAHVVIRFGVHAYYEYIWIFDPAHVPLGELEGVQHLAGAVYLSTRNE